MVVFNIGEFPYTEFGEGLKRKVRLVMSPFTTGDERFSIVHVNVPPGGISEGHTHEDSDELIYFDNDGKAIVDNEEFIVEKNSLVLAPRGKKHECINTSKTEELNLLCFFIPFLKPYGAYNELIDKTRLFLKKTAG